MYYLVYSWLAVKLVTISLIHILVGNVSLLENPRTIPLELFDVQLDSYFGKDDIIRFEINIGAVKDKLYR